MWLCNKYDGSYRLIATTLTDKVYLPLIPALNEAVPRNRPTIKEHQLQLVEIEFEFELESDLEPGLDDTGSDNYQWDKKREWSHKNLIDRNIGEEDIDALELASHTRVGVI